MRVIETARASLSTESREARELIAYLHRSRDEMEEVKRQSREELAQLELERNALRTEWVERQRKRIAELERNFVETQKRLEAEVARLTDEIRERSVRAQVEKQVGKRLGSINADARADKDAAIVEALSASQADLGVHEPPAPKPVDAKSLQSGQKITVKGFKQPVIFRRHDGRTAEVEAGPLRMRVPLTDILSTDAPTSNAKPQPQANTGSTKQVERVTVNSQPTDQPSAEEINVIGCRVEEATELVDKFIDVAALAGKPSVRIIHGYGTGALRRGLAEFLSAHPLVEGIRHEPEDRGGKAITIADLVV
jgi:DNA mismatch repair protein MutS2